MVLTLEKFKHQTCQVCKGPLAEGKRQPLYYTQTLRIYDLKFNHLRTVIIDRIEADTEVQGIGFPSFT